MNLNKLANGLIRAGVMARDLNAWLSGDPKRIARRYANKFIGRMVNRLTRGLYLRGNNRK